MSILTVPGNIPLSEWSNFFAAGLPDIQQVLSKVGLSSGAFQWSMAERGAFAIVFICEQYAGERQKLVEWG
jgi:hypothetical protein